MQPAPLEPGAALGELAASSWQASGFQLTARGCAPIDPLVPTEVIVDPEDPALWRLGVDRAHALTRTAPELDQAIRALPSDLVDAAASLATRTELLLVLGGDDRNIPVDGRNSYGLPLYDLDPEIRLSSCTAVPPDREAIAAGDAWRRRELEDLLQSGEAPDPAVLHRAIARGIGECLGFDENISERIVLSASGTEAESLLTAIVVGDGSRGVVNILVGCLEAGCGTRTAASGRRFQSRTPFGSSAPQSLIPGFERSNVSIVDIDLRDHLGRPRKSFDVEAELDAHIDDALASGKKVLVHVMDRSKTGLRQPTVGWVRHRLSNRPRDLRIIVDAAQARLPRQRVHDYLEAGASVLITGSKAISGPPFSAAIILDDALLHDACSLDALPAGLADNVAQADLPPAMAHLASNWNAANYGLLARWHVALSEWDRVNEVPIDRQHEVRDSIVGALRSELAKNPRLQVLPGGSIVSICVQTQAGRASHRELDAIYRAVVSQPGVQIGQPVELVPGGFAALRFVVGTATITRLLDTGESISRQAGSMSRRVLQHLEAALAGGHEIALPTPRR